MNFQTVDVLDLIPSVKKFDAVSVTEIKNLPKEEFDQAVGAWSKNEEAEARLNPMLYKDDLGCIDMTFEARWVSKDQMAPFGHVEQLGERWHPVENLEIGWTASGEKWDERTLNLHPAVASLATTDAGFDQAYLTALSATHQLMGPAQRIDINQASREHIGLMLRQSLQPFRLLMRGVSLWFAADTTVKYPTNKVPIQSGCNVPDPRLLNTPSQFNGNLLNHANGPHDAIYIRTDDSTGPAILAALCAMTASRHPVQRASGALKAMWPEMHQPVVYYSSDMSLPAPRAPISKEGVWMALVKLAETYDCWDLLDEAFRTVPILMFRPKGMAAWMGRDKFAWNLPESNLKAGICGPLFNGVSAQGMKTAPFSEPSSKQLMIEGCVRASFLLSSAHMNLNNYSETHFAFREQKGMYKPMLAGLAALRFTQTFHDSCGSIAKALGWPQAMGRSLRGMRIGAGHHIAKAFLDSGNYPSTLSLLPWTKATKADALGTAVLRPAIPEIPGSMFGWLAVERQGIVSDAQLAAAILRMPVEVRYKVEFPGGETKWIPGPTQLNVNRGLPLMSVRVLRGDVKLSTQVRIKNTDQYLKARILCSSLNHSHVVVEQFLGTELDASFWDDHVENLDLGPTGRGSDSGSTAGEESESESEPEDENEVRKGETVQRPNREEVVGMNALGAKISKLTGLRLGDIATENLQPEMSLPTVFRTHMDGQRKILEALERMSPEKAISNVPPALRADTARSIASIIGQCMGLCNYHGRIADMVKYQDTYGAIAAAMETNTAMTVDELVQSEELQARGLVSDRTVGNMAAQKLAEDEGLGTAAQVAAYVAGPTAKSVQWAKEMERKEQDFQGSPSGSGTFSPGSGTNIPKKPVGNVRKGSKVEAGTLGFSDPGASSPSTRSVPSAEPVVQPASEPTGAEAS